MAARAMSISQESCTALCSSHLPTPVLADNVSGEKRTLRKPLGPTRFLSIFGVVPTSTTRSGRAKRVEQLDGALR